LKFPAALNVWADIYEIIFLALRLTVSSRSVIKQFLCSCLLQAEELNSIVGNAFRMAYAAQLQRQPTFQDVIASQLQDKTTSVENNNSRINWVSHFVLGQK
jgi:N-acetylglutamate synthase-like GNAT family acetyltransferase